MDWIERLFHLAPDGGSGSLEVGIVAGAAVALALMVASAIKLRAAVTHWCRSVSVSAARKRANPADPV
jgi:hypothetical protein